MTWRPRCSEHPATTAYITEYGPEPNSDCRSSIFFLARASQYGRNAP
jgi:hypothetical protein